MVNKPVLIGLLVLISIISFGALFFLFQTDVLHIFPESNQPQPTEVIEATAVSLIKDKAFDGVTGVIVQIVVVILTFLFFKYILPRIKPDIQLRERMTVDEIKNNLIIPQFILSNGIVASIPFDEEKRREIGILYNEDSIRFNAQKTYVGEQDEFVMIEAETTEGKNMGTHTFKFNVSNEKQEIEKGKFSFEYNRPMTHYMRDDIKTMESYPSDRITNPQERLLDKYKELIGKEQFEEIARRQLTQEPQKVIIEQQEKKLPSQEERYNKPPK